jgi:hypothetical protein
MPQHKFLQQILDDINTQFEPITKDMEHNLNILENFLGEENTKFNKLTIEDIHIS